MSQPTETTTEKPGAIEDKALTADDAFNFLSEEGDAELDDKDKKPADKKPADKDEKDEDDEDDKDEKDEKDEEVDELAELEAELDEDEEPGKDKLELVTPVRRRDILKKFPTLFKEFPYLEKAYYREQQFTKYFPDPDDAKEAISKAETLENFEKDIIQDGNTTNILRLIKENNPNKFAEVVDNYLDHLAEVDNSSYQHVLSNVTKNIIAAMYQEGKAQDNDTLMEAAVILNQYAFGSSKYKPPTKLARPGTDKEKSEQTEISTREKELVKQAYENTASDVSSKVNNFFKTNIEANIDPKKSMTDYVRKNASKDALEKVQDLISRDTRFKQLTDRLWSAAIKSNFSKASVDKIKQAYILKGRSLLAPVTKSARNEALRGMGKRVKDDIEETDTDKESSREKEKPETERRRSSSKPKAKEVPPGMSTLEYLSQD